MRRSHTHRILLAAILLLGAIGSHAVKIKYPGKRVFVYRYYLTDKPAAGYSLDKPQKFLTRKSLDRRQRQGLGVDSTDLPVARDYVKQFQLRKTEVLGTSRWQNTVLVRSTDSTTLIQLAQLPIVRDARCVFISPDSIDKPEVIRWNVHDDFRRWDSVKNDSYGMARQQIEMLNGIRLHEAGMTGRGITIAILDGGFQNYDRIPALSKAHVMGIRDFVEPANTNQQRMSEQLHPTQGTTFQDIDHGTKVFSAMAARAPEVIIGTAPDASYWLLRSEMHDTEQPIEEDYWTMAAEFADSVGVDIINSSLGYYAYDDGLPSYRLRDLDGQTAFISRTASMLAKKGIILCNSAGNSGMGQWKKIGVPADAHDIITVGAIDAEGKIAPFSSVGPSQDGRVKPDVVARGNNTTLVSGRGTLVRDMGTSFSTPVTCGMVACLWQALREHTALQLMELIRQSGDQYEAPNNIFGYGIPDFWKAYQTGLGKQ
ncbi:MAG: S8 family serine peptidase [Prevotella sp.]|nr:S8 family serine peptidase [Prevotella sp.]